jgi:acyl-CoA dehydrogenase
MERLFSLPQELSQFREGLRRFVDRELIPVEQKVQKSGEISPDLHAELSAKAKAAGFWLLDVPEEYGGQALGVLALAVFWEEISRTVGVPARDHTIFGPNVGPILLGLKDEQKQRYLFPVLKGEKTLAHAPFVSRTAAMS